MTSASHGNWQKYRNQNPLQKALIGRFLHRLLALQADLSIETALDVGCAEGFVLEALTQTRPRLKATGVDIDLEALTRGRRLFPGIPLGRADLFNLPFPSGSFDLVLCTEVLEHLSNPDAALEEICRISRRYCLFSVPHEPFFRLSNLIRGKNLRRLGNDVEHLQNWGQAAFLRVLGRRLKIIQVQRSFPWLIALGEISIP